MKSLCVLLTLFLFVLTPLSAQTNVNVGDRSPNVTSLERAAGAEAFRLNFPEESVGFLHVYIDPVIDPLETYLMRGVELTAEAVKMLPSKFRRLASRNNAKMYGAAAIKGINENLYLMRMDGDRRDQIDMFAVRNDKVKHIKTIAYRDCGNGECLQLDSYLTDVNLDTDLDLIQIARRTTASNGTTDEKRTAYIMSERNRKWKRTTNLDVPWEGIEFYDVGDHEN